MTSLLQHDGGRSPDGRKIRLLLVLNPTHCDACGEPITSPFCHRHGNAAHYTAARECFTGPDGKRYGVLHRIYRRPAGMLGPWVVFRYNGAEHCPDLSVPVSVDRLPRDAERVPDAEAFEHWKK